MNLLNDAGFMGMITAITMLAVWALEKLPWRFTTSDRPIIANILGAICGFAYSFPAVYEFLNRAPQPEGATPLSYIVGGWMAGLAAIGAHQTIKNTGVLKAGGVGLLVLTLVLGGAGIAMSSCASGGGSGQTLGDMIDAATITQSQARTLLIQVQDARVAVLKSVAAAYLAAPNDPRVIELANDVNTIDVRFSAAWRIAARAVDEWSPTAFVAAYNDALYEVETMKREAQR